MRIGLIGAGRIANVHARSLHQTDDATLVAVTDPDDEACEALAVKYGLKRHESADSMFADDEIDAVVICSPTPQHIEHILGAARSGKPALCEKPVAMETSSVEKLNKDLEGLDPIVMLGFNRRFDPSFARVHELATEGAVGKIEQVTIISRDPAAPPREYIATSGGIFKDMTIHDFDMARFFLGDIVTVAAIGQNLDPDLKDTGDFDGAVITLTNAEGAAATIVNSRHCASGYDQRLEVFGCSGTLEADNLRPTTVRVSGRESTAGLDPYLDFFLTRYEAAYARELDEFLSAISEGRTPSPNIDDGAKALRIAEAAEESARTGTIVTL